MKKAFLVICGLIALSLSMQSFRDTPQKDGTEELSPFVGIWDWVWDDDIHQFSIWCGERNDSLYFTIGGVFFHGGRIHLPEWDKDEKYIQMVRVKKPQACKAKSKLHENISNFHCYDSENKYNDIIFEMLSDTVMLFILNDNKPYWPDTAIMKKSSNKNIEFSDQTYEYIYNGE